MKIIVQALESALSALAAGLTSRLVRVGRCHSREVGAATIIATIRIEMPLPKIHRTFLCLALVVLPPLFAFDPAATWWFPSCPLRALTGWLCPFCGSLRAVHALVHGDPRVALALNPLVTAGVLIGMAALVSDAVRPVRTSRFEGLLARCVGIRGLAIVIAFAVLRNVPWRSLGWMAQ